MENIHYEAMMRHVITVINFSDDSIQKPDTVYNYEFQNLLISLIQVMTEKDKVYKETLQEITNISNLIEIELFK